MAIDAEQGEQATVARPKVEDATSVGWRMVERDALSLCAARTVVHPAEIALDVLVGRPFLAGIPGSSSPPAASGDDCFARDEERQ